MREHGIVGAKRRGKPWRTTTPDPDATRPRDLLAVSSPPAPRIGLWVGDFERHEALRDRGGGEMPSPSSPSQRVGEAGGSLIRETAVRVASSPNNDGTGRDCRTAGVRQASPEGVREKPAVESSSSEPTSPEPGRCGLGSRAHPTERSGNSQLGDVAGREVTVKVCGVRHTTTSSDLTSKGEVRREEARSNSPASRPCQHRCPFVFGARFRAFGRPVPPSERACKVQISDAAHSHS
jgi:hypothetical protein